MIDHFISSVRHPSSDHRVISRAALEGALLLHQVDRFFVEAHAAERFALGFERVDARSASPRRWSCAPRRWSAMPLIIV